MTLVAISQRLCEIETYPETRDCLDVRWASLFARLDLVPLVLPSAYDPSVYFERFSPAGLVLTGGNDLSSVSPNRISAMRDDFERSLLDLAVEREVPVLGVCRGMQFVSNHFGSLVERVSGHTAGATHAIAVDRASRFGALLVGLASVRSYHDYGVLRLPQGFREVARSNDGVIEAMEHVTLPIYCQMWHPEREDALTEGEAAVFRRLFGLGGG